MSVSAEVATLFLDEMARRNVPVNLGSDGGYQVTQDNFTYTISLENLSRDYAEDRDPTRVARFVDVIVRQVRVPNWETARPRIRWAMEPADMPLGEAFHEKVSDHVARVLVHVSDDEMQIMWVAPHVADKWGQTEESLRAVAEENMAALVAATSLTVQPTDGHKLGMLNTEHSAFKAAMVFSPRLKALVEPELGWPIMAVLPCRDFVFLLPVSATELFPRVGSVVVKQYAEGGYPLCTEVFEVGDDGVRATGEFQRAPQAAEESPEADDDGMKTIQYRGGVVTFRVPAFWTEEYQEEGGGTFYDELEDFGTLRLNTIVVASKNPITTRDARDSAEKRAAQEGGTVEDLGGGNWLNTYTNTHPAEEDHPPQTIRYWEITNPVPPKHLRIALFSYSVATELLEDGDEEVAEELGMVEREVRACGFAAEIGE
jgi:hypothetical protein